MNATLPQTLAHAARELSLFDRVAAAVRSLEVEDDAGVAHVIVAPSKGEIIVIGDDHTLCALRVAA